MADLSVELETASEGVAHASNPATRKKGKSDLRDALARVGAGAGPSAKEKPKATCPPIPGPKERRRHRRRNRTSSGSPGTGNAKKIVEVDPRTLAA
jgi:hypothetical protein